VSGKISISDQLAGIVLDIRRATLPDAVTRQAKRLILDTLGCAIGAIDAPPCAGVRALVDELGGRAEATVIGQRKRTNCTLAAFVNGTLLRFTDANDYYFGRDPAHASGNLAAALAVAERQKLTGRDLIVGLVTGYEIQLRLCDTAGNPNLWDRGWHHATNMQFSSAALSASLLDLDRAGIRNAIAIAGTHNNTLTESMRGEMATIKASIEATTAKAGVEAALMAKHGLTGPAAIFEGTFGWANVVAGAIDVDELTRALDGHFRIMDTCMKPHAAHALSQGVIQAAIDVMRDYKIAPSRIAAVEAGYPERVLRQPAMDKAKMVMPRNKETADHSPPYLVAMGLLFGECGPAQFTDEHLVSCDVRRLVERIEIKADARVSAAWPRTMGGSVSVTTTDGKRHETVCSYPPGHPRNRLTDAALGAKFRRYTEHVIDARQADAIIGAVATLECCSDLAEFTTLLGIDWRS